MKIKFFTGSLVQLEFNEIDKKNNMIEIPASKMKRDEVHYVPFTKPIKGIIKKLEDVNKEYGYILISQTKQLQGNTKTTTKLKLN